LSFETQLIFVSIAAYRDLQLAPTIADCIAKAVYPERLRFGICWQHGAEETTLPYFDDSRFRILDVDYRDSRGACWARSEILKLWRNEDWLLQVDSHCRFAKGWDEAIIRLAQESGSVKPILTTYATPFVPCENSGEAEYLSNSPMLIALGGFSPEGLPLLKPIGIDGWNQLSKPLRARFIAAGFVFAPASFVEDVGYDPELYFFGEEIAMTVRAFTHGYDIFHPIETLVWHDYVRKDATRHWDDHKEKESGETTHIQQNWGELDRQSRAKIKCLIAGEQVDTYGLGTVRTLSEYEAYAGLSFNLRKAQIYTVRGGEPPNQAAEADWAASIHTWMVRIHFDRRLLPAEAFDPGCFWCVGVHDDINAEIFRRDVQRAELEALSGDEPTIVLVCEFESAVLPVSWSVWPVSRTQGWLKRISGKFDEKDYAIVMDDDGDSGQD
jgi:Glycosyltransferase (GlcNAc)